MQTVCFETAKLAKEKGFDAPVCSWYNFSGLFIKGWEDELQRASNDKKFPSCLAPNQYQLSDWLRVEHNLHIEILYDYENDNTSYHYAIRTIGKENGRDWKEDYATYEECLETALQEALKMI